MVTLKEDVGASAVCTLNVTFGCEDTESSVMWVKDGCRGVFICNGNLTGICGFRRWPLRTECPCTANVQLRERLKSAWGVKMKHTQRASWQDTWRSTLHSEGNHSCVSWSCEGLAYESCTCLGNTSTAPITSVAPDGACSLQVRGRTDDGAKELKVAHAPSGMAERAIGLSGQRCKDGEACKCTPHSCGANCCSTCMHQRPRVLFAHVDKTGGSALECASQSLARQGLWVNMGHTTQKELERCIAMCKPAAVLISVRNPYAWYTSAYHEALRTGWLAGRSLNASEGPPTSERRQYHEFRAQVLSNLSAFVVRTMSMH